MNLLFCEIVLQICNNEFQTIFSLTHNFEIFTNLPPQPVLVAGFQMSLEAQGVG